MPAERVQPRETVQRLLAELARQSSTSFRYLRIHVLQWTYCGYLCSCKRFRCWIGQLLKLAGRLFGASRARLRAIRLGCDCILPLLQYARSWRRVTSWASWHWLGWCCRFWWTWCSRGRSDGDLGHKRLLCVWSMAEQTERSLAVFLLWTWDFIEETQGGEHSRMKRRLEIRVHELNNRSRRWAWVHRHSHFKLHLTRSGFLPPSSQSSRVFLHSSVCASRACKSSK